VERLTFLSKYIYIQNEMSNEELLALTDLKTGLTDDKKVFTAAATLLATL
jgi:hypothetical protein